MKFSYLKTIDKYLIRQFIGPFIATFFIALFVLMMQFIWVYVDDMVGKGAGFGLVLEVILYKSISLIPWALPVATLISSVMVLGGLGERYELASLKSAGVPLIRVMRPLLIFATGVTIFSFICSNNLIPISNLKFQSRLHDIRTQKPTLNLEEGVFNEDFKGFVIHIGKKDTDGRSIRDVIIYDHQDYTKSKLSMITAETGEMFMTDDNTYFVMNLKNGFHYQEGTEKRDQKEKKYPFMRTKFQEWTKVFDTKEFNIDLTDMNRFKTHYTMLSVRQLFHAIDSIENRLTAYDVRLDEYIQKCYSPLKKVILKRQKEENARRKAERREFEKKKAEQLKKQNAKKASEKKVGSKNSKLGDKPVPIPSKKRVNQKKSNAKERAKAKKEREKATQAKKKKKKTATDPKAKTKFELLKFNPEKPLKEYASFYQLIKKADRTKYNLKERAKTTTRGIINQAKNIGGSVKPRLESRVKHVFVLYSKITFALVCCVFLFIGAPMGAIVRKGGFGYPLLISILFFMLFIILNILFQKLAESMTIPAEIAVWCPLLILLPIGILLTKRAMEDKKVVNMDNYISRIKKIIRYFKKDSIEAS